MGVDLKDLKPKRPKGQAMICCMLMAAVAASVRDIFWRCGVNPLVDFVCTRKKGDRKHGIKQRMEGRGKENQRRE